VHVGIKAAYPHAVVNATVTAIGGENSLSGAKRFERDVLSLRPDVVVIDYALNDRGVGLDAARAAWTSMIVACRQKNIKVILCTPTGDTSSRRNDPNDALVQHTEQIKRLASEHEVGLADVFAAWSAAIAKVGEPVLHSQGNHPSFDGHKVAESVITPWFTAPVKGRQCTRFRCHMPHTRQSLRSRVHGSPGGVQSGTSTMFVSLITRCLSRRLVRMASFGM
jgi:hypothetical protein